MLDEGAFQPKDDFFLMMSQPKGPEKIILFSSPGFSDNIARMNFLPDSIVVEHTVDQVESATYAPHERKEALKFVESLLYLF